MLAHCLMLIKILSASVDWENKNIVLKDDSNYNGYSHDSPIKKVENVKK